MVVVNAEGAEGVKVGRVDFGVFTVLPPASRAHAASSRKTWHRAGSKCDTCLRRVRAG
jgi:hypothetical protein